MTSYDVGKLEWRSYVIGMNYAFAEVVGSGVKQMGLSPPLTLDEFEAIIDDTKEIAAEYGVTLHVDDSFLETLLFDPAYTRGKTVIHFADSPETVQAYKQLRDRKNRLQELGRLTREAEEEIAWGLGRLLSYSDEAIRGLIRSPRFSGAGED